MTQSQFEQGGAGAGNSMGKLLFVAQSIASTVEVFLHVPSSFGSRYIGAQVAVGALIAFCFPALRPDLDPEPLQWFLASFFFMCVVVGLAVKKRCRDNDDEHSTYNGRPRSFGRNVSEGFAKSALEPMLVMFVGLLVSEVSELLGLYLLFAGVALAVSVNMSLAVERARVREMRDAYLEQQRLAEQFRNGHFH